MLHFCIIYFNSECLFQLFRAIPVCFDENQIEMSQKTTVVRSYPRFEKICQRVAYFIDSSDTLRRYSIGEQ